MKLLLIGTWDPADPAIPPMRTAEKSRTQELVDAGFVENLYLRTDGLGAYMILTADSLASAEEQLAALPFVGSGVMSSELVELRD